jgi:hypothetical protein
MTVRHTTSRATGPLARTARPIRIPDRAYRPARGLAGSVQTLFAIKASPEKISRLNTGSMKVRQERAEESKGPQKAEECADKTAADYIYGRKGCDTAHRIDKTGRELVHAERFHGKRLQPEKEGRLLVERLIVYRDLEPVAADKHLARRFGKIGFVPVKQVHLPESRKEKEGAKENERDEEVPAFSVS